MDNEVEMDPGSPAESRDSMKDAFDELEVMRTTFDPAFSATEEGNHFLYLLNKTGCLDELEKARFIFAIIHRLTLENWKDWLISERDEYEDAIVVFEKSQKDTNNVELWVEMIYISISEGVTETRELCERALSVHANRYDTGGQIWSVYLSFETELIKGDQTDENAQNLFLLYKRALRFATANLDDIYEDAKRFFPTEHDELRQIYETTCQFAKTLEKYENDLETYEGYQRYLQFEIESGDISRIQMMHERIVEAFPFEECSWLAYGSFCEKVLKINSTTAKVYERAMRNCEGSAALMQQGLLALERANKTKDEIDRHYRPERITSCFEDQKNVHRTYLYLLRRRVANKDEIDYLPMAMVFQAAVDMLKEYFPNDFDTKAEFRQNHAYFLAALGGSIKQAREVWTDILASGFGKYAQKWIEAVRLERQFGDNDYARKLLTKALNSVSDNITEIYEYYIQFEREEGTLEQLETVLEKINSQVAHRASRPQKALKPVEEKKERNVGNKRGHGGGIERNDRKLKAGPSNQPVATSSSTNPEQQPTPNDENSARTVFVSNLDFGTTEEDIKKVLEGVEQIRFAKRAKGDLHRGFGYVVLKNAELSKKAVQNDRVMVNGRPMFVSVNDPAKRVGFKYSKGLEKSKLFVKNVHFKADEGELKTLFSQYGTVSNVRLVRHKNGQPKGVAYVDFETEEAATKALMATKIELRERELEVALSNPPSKTDKKPDVPGPSSSSITPMDTSDQSTHRKTMLQFVPRSAKPSTSASASSSSVPSTSSSTEQPKHKPMSNDMFRQFLNKKSE